MKPITSIQNSTEYHAAVGRVMCFCQCIEQDIKAILRVKAKEAKTILPPESKTWTLGQVVHELEEIDYKTPKPFFSKNDYAFLRKLTHLRNHYAHQCYLDWVHASSTARKEEFDRSAEKLIKDHNNLQKLFELLEKTVRG